MIGSIRSNQGNRDTRRRLRRRGVDLDAAAIVALIVYTNDDGVGLRAGEAIGPFDRDDALGGERVEAEIVDFGAGEAVEIDVKERMAALPAIFLDQREGGAADLVRDRCPGPTPARARTRSCRRPGRRTGESPRRATTSRRARGRPRRSLRHWPCATRGATRTWAATFGRHYSSSSRSSSSAVSPGRLKMSRVASPR